MPTPIPAPIDAIKIKGSVVVSGVTLLPLSSDKACNRNLLDMHAVYNIQNKTMLRKS